MNEVQIKTANFRHISYLIDGKFPSFEKLMTLKGAEDFHMIGFREAIVLDARSAPDVIESINETLEFAPNLDTAWVENHKFVLCEDGHWRTHYPYQWKDLS